MNDSGGSAFPEVFTDEKWSEGHSNFQRDTYSAGGMTLRDYFIAHAPVEPWLIYQPVMPPRPTPGIWHNEDGSRHYSTFSAAEKECGDNCYLSNQAELDAWDVEKKFQHYAQWPAYWADAMLKARQP